MGKAPEIIQLESLESKNGKITRNEDFIMISVNMHNCEVTSLYRLTGGTYSLTLKDESGSHVTMYFDSLVAVRDFSRLISLMTAQEGETLWEVKED